MDYLRISPRNDLALELEGLTEAMENVSDEIHLEELLDIARRLEEEMKEL